MKDSLGTYTLEGAETTSYQWAKQLDVGYPW